MDLNRRNFLGWSAVGAAGILLPELIRPRVTTVVFGSGRREPFLILGLPIYWENDPRPLTYNDLVRLSREMDIYENVYRKSTS